MRAVCSGLLLLTLAVPVAADEMVRQWDEAIGVEAARELILELSVAEVVVEGTAGDTIELSMTAECDRRSERCREAAERIEFEVDRRGNRLLVELEGWPQRSRNAPDLRLELRVPSPLALDIDLGVGEIDVSGMESDLDIEAGVGEVRIQARESAVSTVSLDTGVGEVSLRPRQTSARSGGFIGQELRWRDGPGASAIHVDVGVGEIDVLLEGRRASKP